VWIAVTVVVVLLAAGAGAYWAFVRPRRSVEGFCDVYAERSAQLGGGIDGTGAAATAGFLGDPGSVKRYAQAFDELDEVAPEEIEPDVRAVRDFLRRRAAVVDPAASLGSLAAGMFDGLQVAGSFVRVQQYVTRHCDTN